MHRAEGAVKPFEANDIEHDALARNVDTPPGRSAARDMQVDVIDRVRVWVLHSSYGRTK